MSTDVMYVGDEEAARSMHSLALSQLRILLEHMRFQNLKQSNRLVKYHNGSEIHINSVFGYNTITVFVPLVEGTEEVVLEELVLKEEAIWLTPYFMYQNSGAPGYPRLMRVEDDIVLGPCYLGYSAIADGFYHESFDVEGDVFCTFGLETSTNVTSVALIADISKYMAGNVHELVAAFTFDSAEYGYTHDTLDPAGLPVEIVMHRSLIYVLVRSTSNAYPSYVVCFTKFGVEQWRYYTDMTSITTSQAQRMDVDDSGVYIGLNKGFSDERCRVIVLTLQGEMLVDLNVEASHGIDFMLAVSASGNGGIQCEGYMDAWPVELKRLLIEPPSEDGASWSVSVIGTDVWDIDAFYGRAADYIAHGAVRSVDDGAGNIGINLHEMDAAGDITFRGYHTAPTVITGGLSVRLGRDYIEKVNPAKQAFVGAAFPRP